MARHSSPVPQQRHTAMVDSRRGAFAPARDRDISDVAPGEWFARPDVRQSLRSLPDVRTVRIEINGCLAGAADCLAEATREFALGWAFLHRFYSTPEHLGTISGSSGRVAIMLDSGEDIDRRRLEAVGWVTRDDDIGGATVSSARPPRTVPFVSQHDTIAVSERAFARFEVDGRSSGLACAALARGDELAVIARDIASRGAVAKILGWMMSEETDVADSMLIVSGLVDEIMVEGASRAGIGIVVTDAEPTAAAIRRATMQGTTVLGLVMSHRRSFFADGGHVGDDTAPLVDSSVSPLP